MSERALIQVPLYAAPINHTSQTPLAAASRAYSEKRLGLRPKTRSTSSVT